MDARWILVVLLIVNAVICFVGIFTLDGMVLSSMAGGASLAWGHAALDNIKSILGGDE